jgi:exodeoxyribonuclease VII large subunit
MSLPLLHTPTQAPDRVLTVSQLTAQIKDLLEDELPSVWLLGEISNLSRPNSGHVYLTLKDDRSQIRAVIWRTTARRMVFDLTDGLEVIVHGRCTVYEGRGEYQLVVDHMQPKGLGALELAFRQLRDRLEKEGLFARERKKPLPRFPRRIVLVTSPSGAAIRDMLQILRRRWCDVEIWLRPVPVQGDGAAPEIAAAIREVNRIAGVDLMIVARGGGSLEDLWAFDEEPVARAIFASKIPIVSAIGHEVDWTIADYVADLRAPTPSAAAELVVPSESEVREQLAQTGVRMARSLESRLRAARHRLEYLAARRAFQFPLDGIAWRLQRADELAGRMARAIANRLSDGGHRLARLAAQIEGLSPLNVLARGYSLTTRDDGLTVIRRADQVATGDRIITRLGEGRVTSCVETSEKEQTS